MRALHLHRLRHQIRAVVVKKIGLSERNHLNRTEKTNFNFT